MIEGQEGVDWPQWLALARRRGGRRPRGALPLRPLPLDRARRAGRRPRRLGDPRAIAASTEPDPARDDGLAGHLPARLGAREERRRPSTTSRAGGSSSGSAPAGTRPSTRPTASRSCTHAARGSTSSTGSSRRSRASSRPPTTCCRSRCSSHGRRSSSAVARSRAPCAQRSRSPTSTTPSSRASTTHASGKQILDDAARAAGREPLRFSMMIGCVVGRDRAEADERIGAWRALTGRDAAARDRRHGRRGRRAPARIRGCRRRARDAPAPRPRGCRDGRGPGRGRRRRLG